jgi:hypothetical protein
LNYNCVSIHEISACLLGCFVFNVERREGKKNSDDLSNGAPFLANLIR